MVRRRLITVLTINNGVLFRTRNFLPDYRYTLNFTDAWSVDEVVLLDITRTDDGERAHFEDIVKAFAGECFVPLAVGGGIRDVRDVKHLLSIGADKVTVNTGALERPALIREIAELFGSQCVVVSLDAKDEGNGEYQVYSHFGKHPTGMNPVECARMAESQGAGEIMIQSIDRDGTLEGYDNRLNRLVSEAVGVPVLVCSGAGRWEHFVEGFQEGGASAVCTTNIYHFTESSIHSAKAHIAAAGIDVRL